MTENFEFKINYDECITNVACSILKYFKCEYYHKTIPILDEILSKKNPNNVILILFDGLGSRNLDKSLDKNSFLLKNRIKEITSVFPSTTASSTLSIQTGLNPSEHGYLGWSNYISPIDTIIQLFLDVEKGRSPKDEKNKNFIKIKQDFLSPKKLVDIIKEKNCDTYTISPYEESNKLEEFFNKNIDKETIVIITADHGHINCENIFLKNYSDIKELMEKNIYIENRCPMFKIKEGKKDLFKELFNKYFGEYFYLLSKEEIINRKIFGDINFKENELFNGSLGDFMAINKNNNNKAIFGDNDFFMKSVHGGISDDEIYIPLIVLSK